MAYKRSHLSPRTRAYTKAGAWAFEVVIGSHGEDTDKAAPSEHDYGWKPIWIKFLSGRNRPMWLSLTSMTLEELESFKRIMDIAIEDARPVVKSLDEQAIEVLMNGAEDVPIRALASAPPWFDRKIDPSYVEQEDELEEIPPPYEGDKWEPVEDEPQWVPLQ
jgi:hypothetical protein